MSGRLPWRTGRKVGRTVYDADDELIGVMDTPNLAHHVVWTVNTAHRAASQPADALAAEERGSLTASAKTPTTEEP